MGVPSRGAVCFLSVSTRLMLTAAAPWRDEGSTGEIHTALPVQLAGLFVQREDFQIPGTGCCFGKPAKENKKEGKRTQAYPQAFFRVGRQELSGGLTHVYRIREEERKRENWNLTEN